MSEIFSPGVVYGCFEFLDTIALRSMRLGEVENLGKFGVANSKDVAACAQILKWVEVDDSGFLLTTKRGQIIRVLPKYEERLKEALLDFVEVVNPPWVQNARFGRRHVLKYSPPEITQIFREAGLATGSSVEVVEFWDLLAARARGSHGINLNETGRKGERLTIQYEEKRTGKAPRWVALDSNFDGYDVLSSMSRDDNAPLCIESKASLAGLDGTLYFTRHEWEVACDLINFNVYLWDLSSIFHKLAIIDVEDIEAHIPKDNGKGRWETVSIPFSFFEKSFIDVPKRIEGI